MAGETGLAGGLQLHPGTAINQLEMWQADTFDPATIDRELGWAESLGFNSVRVFLHHLLWEQDANGFLQRLDVPGHGRETEGRRDVRLFDSVWDPFPKPASSVHRAGPAQLGLGAEPRASRSSRTRSGTTS